MVLVDKFYVHEGTDDIRTFPLIFPSTHPSSPNLQAFPYF